MSENRTKQEKNLWHAMPPEKVAELLKTDISHGLSEKEAEKRYYRVGENKLPEEKPLSGLRIFLDQFKSPLVSILVFASIITLLIQEWFDAIFILSVVFLNAVGGFLQENKASKALRSLKKTLQPKTTVLRQGQEQEILQSEVVPGDIVILKNGDKVPADGRIIFASNLKINEAILTGEWLPANKTKGVLPSQTPLSDRDNMVYMGTIVETGEGRVIVTATGKDTQLGHIAQFVKETKEEKTPYQKKIIRFSRLVTALIVSVSFFIFIGGLAAGKSLIEIFITAVAVAVAALPEGLPMAITIIFALGMQRILKRGGLVRKMASAETLGSTSVIATDKTLTLTEGRMKVKEVFAQNKKRAVKIAALCNEAFIENPQDLKIFWRIKGRPTDRALIEFAAEKGISKPQLEKELPKIDEIPFNSKNKFIASLHLPKEKKPQETKELTGKSNLLLCSGAPEKILELCQLTEDQKRSLYQKLTQLASEGLRVIALASKQTPASSLQISDITQLNFEGFIGLDDPLREDAKKAIKQCQKAGMKVLIVTGDHLLTAKAVAEKLGLPTKKENILTGDQLDKLSNENFNNHLFQISVFARVEPRHKLRIINAFQEKGRVVAMTGDGVNDAPALKKADIGVALGSGTEVAKEVSDLVLLNDNFSVIVAAVEEGRTILDNIRKVITYLFADSFTEIILIGASILFNLPLPLTALQILWVNLIEDSLPATALAFEPKEDDVMKQKPQDHKAPLLTKEMKVIILVIGILTDLILLGMFLGLLKHFGEGHINYIRTIIFVALGMDSLFYIFACKSLRRNIWRINIFSNRLLVLSWIIGFIGLTASLYVPFLQKILKTQALGLSEWILLLGLSLTKLFLIEFAKHYFIIRHQTNE